MWCNDQRPCPVCSAVGHEFDTAWGQIEDYKH